MSTDGAARNAEFSGRFDRVRAVMGEQAIDYLLIGPSTDMVYLIDFPVRQSERLTMLVISQDEPPRLVMPEFELPRVAGLPQLFEPVTWNDGDDPVTLLTSLLRNPGGGATVGLGGQMFAQFFLRIRDRAPTPNYVDGDRVMVPIRMRKSPYEVEALRAASRAADAVAEDLWSSAIQGATERDVLATIHGLLLEKGHDAVGGGIVGFGANGASPHHHVSDRVATEGDGVVVDFGGILRGYRSDITRTFHIGAPSDEFRHVYDIVNQANDVAFQSARPGITTAELDRIARSHIEDAGYGDAFLHRLGHGIGLDGHEPPYLVTGDNTPLEEGMTFSIEPGIYLEGKFGIRIEDIVVVTGDGAERLNQSTHDLKVV